MKDAVQELPEDEQDLYFISSQVTVVQVHVEDLIYDLIGEISSSSEEGSVDELEQYLTSDSQGMARTKQTAKKTDNQGRLPVARKSPRRSPRILDSDSSLEAAYDLYTVDPMASRSSPRKRTANQTGFTSSDSDGSSRKRRKQNTGGTDQPTPSTSNVSNQPPTPTKDLWKIKKPVKESARARIQRWNRTARIGFTSETKQGWLRKTERKRNDQRQLLRRARPGTRSLQEIRFYQRCQAFLIPNKPFIRLVCDICERSLHIAIRWQSIALFILQTAAEAYVAGFFSDVNLCAVHRKVVTVNRKDVWLAIELRGRDHVGGKPNISDTGACNFGPYNVRDRSEQSGLKADEKAAMNAAAQDWNAKLRETVSAEGGQRR